MFAGPCCRCRKSESNPCRKVRKGVGKGSVLERGRFLILTHATLVATLPSRRARREPGSPARCTCWELSRMSTAFPSSVYWSGGRSVARCLVLAPRQAPLKAEELVLQLQQQFFPFMGVMFRQPADFKRQHPQFLTHFLDLSFVLPRILQQAPKPSGEIENVSPHDSANGLQLSQYCARFGFQAVDFGLVPLHFFLRTIHGRDELLQEIPQFRRFFRRNLQSRRLRCHAAFIAHERPASMRKFTLAAISRGRTGGERGSRN